MTKEKRTVLFMWNTKIVVIDIFYIERVSYKKKVYALIENNLWSTFLKRIKNNVHRRIEIKKKVIFFMKLIDALFWWQLTDTCKKTKILI